MKRTAMQHTKLKRLMRALGCRQYVAVGILESLWHLTARETPWGNIGKLTNEDIALQIDWEGSEDELVRALISSGWLDIDEEHRLLVHDWHEHADDGAKKAMSRHAANLSRQVETGPDSGGQAETAADKTRLPLPKPQPKPEKEQLPSPDPSAVRTDRISDDDVERVYFAYPRHVGKGKACDAIRKAVAHLGTGKDWPKLGPQDALSLLHHKATRFARSPAGNAGDYTPHPSTWFNQARYLDDEREWERGSNQGNSGGNRQPQTRADRNIETLHRNLARSSEVPEGGIDEGAYPAGRGTERGGTGVVLEGIV